MKKLLKKVISVFIVLSFLLPLSVPTFAVVLGSSGPVSSLVSGTIYYIRNKRSGRYMDVSGGGGSGSNILQWGAAGTNNQKWQVIADGSSYVLKPMHLDYGSHYANVYQGNTANGTPIVLYNDGSPTDTGSKWNIIKNSDNSFRMMSCLDTTKAAVIENASTSNGANVILYTYSNDTTYNDEWYFEPVSYLYGTELSTTSRTQASFSVTNETDWYKITPSQQAYFYLYSFAPSGTSYGTNMWLYGMNSNGSLYSIDNGFDEEYSGIYGIKQTLEAGTTYYLSLHSYSTGTGAYTLVVSNFNSSMISKIS